MEKKKGDELGDRLFADDHTIISPSKGSHSTMSYKKDSTNM